MKTKNLALFALVSLSLTTFAQADGAIASGGGSAPPVAVVIQESFNENSEPSLDLEMAIRAQVSDDLASGEVQAFFQTNDKIVNHVGRRRWCIEYSNYDQFTRATRIFQETMRGFIRVEVVSSSRCSRR